MGFKITFAKSSVIVLYDNESFRPQKLNIKIKEWNIFSYAKRISRLRRFCAERFENLPTEKAGIAKLSPNFNPNWVWYGL